MSVAQKILQDDQLDSLLLQQGFVVIPFLNSDEVNSLVNFYYGHHSKSQDGMYATAHVPDVASDYSFSGDAGDETVQDQKHNTVVVQRFNNKLFAVDIVQNHIKSEFDVLALVDL